MLYLLYCTCPGGPWKHFSYGPSDPSRHLSSLLMRPGRRHVHVCFVAFVYDIQNTYPMPAWHLHSIHWLLSASCPSWACLCGSNHLWNSLIFVSYTCTLLYCTVLYCVVRTVLCIGTWLVFTLSPNPVLNKIRTICTVFVLYAREVVTTCTQSFGNVCVLQTWWESH